MDVTDRLRAAFEIGQHGLRLIARDGAPVETLTFATRDGGPVRGVFCTPDGAGRWPAVLVIHAHGNRYDIGAAELLAGRPALAGPLGPALAAMGIASLCLDLPCFGLRAGVAESAAAKAALWQGHSLAGQMLGESHAALVWLAECPEVCRDRLGVFGISMGAMLGMWLSAVDTWVRALVHECCFADYAALIAAGGHDLHEIYLTIPGLLQIASNGQIAGLTAPRAQFIGVGEDDPLTPPAALAPAIAEVQAAYARAGRLMIHREPGSGHIETPAMRAADGHPLLLPARQSPRTPRQQGLDLQQPRGIGDAGVDLDPCHSGVLQTEGHVLPHRHVRIQGIALKHHRQTAVGSRGRRHIRAVYLAPPGCGLVQPRDHPQQRGLAETGWPDEYHQLALADRQVDALQDIHRAEGFGDAAQADPSHRRPLFQTRPGDAGGDEFLQEQKDDDDRDHGHHGHRQDVVPLHVQLARIGVQADLQGVNLFARQDDQRPQKVVPAPDDRKDAQHRQRGCRQRQLMRQQICHTDA